MAVSDSGQPNASAPLSEAALRRRHVPYAALRPCTTAFVDTRTPGSDQKENFTIIGPGVAENPDQYVHIVETHGFNIGAARQPPGCVNSQHSHDTAEVFVIHSGRWAFFSGVQGQDGRVELAPGDVISLPTHAFRGFENVGEGSGFMFAVLGGDDPGRVLWAPAVFAAAEQHGLVLLADGNLVDTAAGEQVPAGALRMPVTSASEVAALSRLDDGALRACVAPRSSFQPAPFSALGSDGVSETLIIGDAVVDAGVELAAGPLCGRPGFQVRHLLLQAGARTTALRRPQPEVLLVQLGPVQVNVDGISLALDTGDTFTVPAGSVRHLQNSGAAACELYIVHGTDAPRSERA